MKHLLWASGLTLRLPCLASTSYSSQGRVLEGPLRQGPYISSL